MIAARWASSNPGRHGLGHLRQAQFPLYSGRIQELPGRILVLVVGLVVAALSVTGVVIWYRKRRDLPPGFRTID